MTTNIDFDYTKIMVNQITISPTQMSEIGEILQIENECGLASWSAEDYLLETTEATSLMLSAKRCGKILGFLIARFQPFNEVDLLNFGVLEKYQERGVGSALWNRLLDCASQRGVESIWLEVRESNLKAIRFYKNKGFIEIQLRKNFYAFPVENARVMKLEL